MRMTLSLVKIYIKDVYVIETSPVIVQDVVKHIEIIYVKSAITIKNIIAPSEKQKYVYSY